MAQQSNEPQRTCIGCRERADRSQLLRVVAAGEAGTHRVVPDTAARLPGRGAWVHHDLACYDLAVRRRAFGRALRLQGPVQPTAVRELLESEQPAAVSTTSSTSPPSTSSGSGSAPDGHPMSSQQ